MDYLTQEWCWLIRCRARNRCRHSAMPTCQLLRMANFCRPQSSSENEVSIWQCWPRCRPVNLWGRRMFADLNLHVVLLRRRNTYFSCEKRLHILWMKVLSRFTSGFRAVLNVTQSSFLVQTNFKFILNSCFIWWREVPTWVRFMSAIN